MSSRFDYIKIGIASPERILSWSRGEVTKPETINYRTLKPERDGLFCERIFGPAKDWECHCGKYKRVRHKGIICERCGVEVTDSKVRRYRMGHIKLAASVAHIWYLKGIPSFMSLLLDIPLKSLENVVYFNEYLVLDPGNAAVNGQPLQERETITEDVFEELESKEATFTAKMGAEAIKELLDKMDMAELAKKLKNDVETSSGTKKAKSIKRLRVVEAFLSASHRPSWMILDVIPVIPPDLRPMVQLDGGRFATSDLNDLYRRVINRNNRLYRLKEMGAPDIIIRNEMRMLQEAVDALIDNGRRGRAVVGPNNRPLKSLSDIIEGKQGRFRQNLLGKRVDYSGRSVIVVGPPLKLHQCGLPKEMALELFKPFVMNKLVERGIVQNIKSAKKKIERGENIVWDILEEVIRNHPVLLNRAPTLHRLGIQAFEPLLVEGRAIQIHPLVCTAFNADFDGDQMAVHVPLSIEAQTEARILMLASNNVLSPATGKPIITPTQDMVLGTYYLTIENAKALRGQGMVFKTFTDALSAFAEGRGKDNHHTILDLHAKIIVRFEGPREEPGDWLDRSLAIADGDAKREWLENALAQKKVMVTTVGRIILNEVLPPEFPFINKMIDKKELGRLIMRAYDQLSATRAAQLANDLKSLGFKYATKAGVSIAIADLYVPTEKREILDRAEREIEQSRHDFLRGQITEVERYSKVIDTWSAATEELTGKIVETYDRLNSVYMMAFSGARGNLSQVRQLVGMRGLMADPAGRIIDLPITSNFREGLNVTEYIISSYGARKGLVDTALRTADSGYLTRRLADVAQDVIVREEDCLTTKGLLLTDIKEGDSVVVPLRDRAVGRVVAADVTSHDPERQGEIIFERGHLLQQGDMAKLAQHRITEMLIRSPLTCASMRGICKLCYGWSLADNHLVNIGEAVGIIAAQSIGEPGTQLTMRTFHTGGVFTAASTAVQIKAKHGGSVHFVEEAVTREYRTKHGARIQITDKECSIDVRYGKKVDHITIPMAFELKVKDGDTVEVGHTLAESSGELRGAARKSLEKAFKEISSDISGMVDFQNFRSEEKTDRQNNVTRLAVPEKGKEGESIIWVVGGDVFSLPAGARIKVKDGQTVNDGDVIAETTISTELGGELRLGADVQLEERGRDTVITGGRDISVVTASLHCDGYLTGTKEPKLRIGDAESGTERLFTVKVGDGQRVENDTIIAEHIDEEDLVPSAGEIRYVDANFLDKDKRTFSKPVKLLFVPEERVSVNKDNSLLMEGFKNGMEVAAGSEVVRDVEIKSNGVMQILEDNNIIREILVFPGERYEIPEDLALEVEDAQEIKEGQLIAQGIKSRTSGIIRVIEIDEDGLKVVVVRRAVERVIKPSTDGIPFLANAQEMALQFGTRLQVKDGERVKAGATLAKTEVTLKLTGQLAFLAGKVELPEIETIAHGEHGEDEIEAEAEVETEVASQPRGFDITILESLALRRDIPALAKRADFREQQVVTYLMAKAGQKVTPGTIVVRTEILSHATGTLEEPRLGEGIITRLLLVTPEHGDVYDVAKRDQLVKNGQYILEGTELGDGKKSAKPGRVYVDGDRLFVRHARPYLISAGTQLLCTSGDIVVMGETLATLVYDRIKTGDIIQGLPRVEELLEARKPKDSAVITERLGDVDMEGDPEEVAKVQVRVEGGGVDEYTVPPGSRVIVNKGDFIPAGSPITDGPINPHDVLRVLGVEATQRYLVDEVQMVYRSQGVEIADKHIEVIVRQMTRKMKVEDPGDSTMLPGELIEGLEAAKIQEEMRATGKAEGDVRPILLGITKASLNTESFVSAASFQETTRVLTEAAIEGKRDWLHGLKENVVIGRLIPAGTGFFDTQEEPEPLGPESAIIGGVPPEVLESI